jgi:hypothetical protein
VAGGWKSSNPVIVPQSSKCFNSKMVKHYALTNVNSDRGFESWPGYEVKPPDCHSSLEENGLLVTGFPATGRIFGRRADVVYPRPGSFGSHGHRIDFCESVALNHFAIKAFCTFRVLFRKVQNALIAKWLSTVFSHSHSTRYVVTLD